MYAPPRAAEPRDEYDVEAARDAGYHPMDVRPRLVALFFGAWAGLALVSLAASVFYGIVFDVGRRAARTSSIDQLLSVYGDAIRPLLMMTVRPAALLLFLSFLFRANANARALGSKALSFTPRSAVLTALVPIANVVFTFRAIREIWYATSRAESEPRSAPRAPTSLLVWWGAWLAAALLVLLGRLPAARAVYALPEPPPIVTIVSMLLNGLVAAGAVAAAFTVSALGRRLRARATIDFSEAAVQRRSAEADRVRDASKAKRTKKAKKRIGVIVAS